MRALCLVRLGIVRLICLQMTSVCVRRSDGSIDFRLMDLIFITGSRHYSRTRTQWSNTDSESFNHHSSSLATTRPKKLGSQLKANLKLRDSEVYPTNRGISRIIEEKPVVAIIPD